MTQAERVRQIRKSLNLTMEKFGERLGVTKTAISLIESGKNSLTDANAKAICRTYNVNYDWLMDGEGEMFSDVPKTVLDELCKQYNLDDFDKALVEMYIALPETCRNAVKTEIRNMIQKLGRWKDDK